MHYETVILKPIAWCENSNNYKETNTDMYSYARAAIGFLLIVSCLWFVWILELLITTSELTDTRLVFFVWNISPLAAYHLLMYVLFLANWIAGSYLLATSFNKHDS